MIVEWFLGLMSGFVEGLADLFGPWDAPPELVDPAGPANSLLSTFHGLGVWVDWGVLIGCIGTAVSVWGAVVGFKLIRAIAAHVPAFGGSGD